MRIQQLKQKRILAGIPGHLVCRRASLARSRLSDIERGYVEPSGEELARIEQALAELIEAREKVAKVAEEVGWPIA